MKIGLNIAAVIIVLMGLVFFFQGIGVIPGSVMTNDPTWAVIGAIMVVLGGGFLFINNRRPTTH